MSALNDNAVELSKLALKDMLVEHGHDYKFPADVIWKSLPIGTSVPSTSRPHLPGILVKERFLAATGAYTKARSKKRAGNMTKEYCFGPMLVPKTTVPTTMASVGSLVGKTASESLVSMQTAMEADGYVIKVGELANFLLAMAASQFVILSGISGTGKSLLPRKFAQHTKSLFRSIPVQSQWSDNSDLFGFVPTLSPDGYIEGKLIGSFRDATANKQELVVVMLDEINLAPVEHYFGDFLSVAETRRRNGTEISSDKLPIDLPAAPRGGLVDPQAELRDMRLPSNLRIVGTANMDETTHVFSPKVIDRAFIIEFGEPDLTSFTSGSASTAETFGALAKLIIDPSNAISVLEARAESQELFDHIAHVLSEIQGILSPAGIKVGYRTRDAILMYLHFWSRFELAPVLPGYEALDFCILQKILPKVSGSGEALSQALQSLADWFKARADAPAPATNIELQFAGPLERSHQKVERMIKLLERDGSTQHWGA